MQFISRKVSLNSCDAYWFKRTNEGHILKNILNRTWKGPLLKLSNSYILLLKYDHFKIPSKPDDLLTTGLSCSVDFLKTRSNLKCSNPSFIEIKINAFEIEKTTKNQNK